MNRLATAELTAPVCQCVELVELAYQPNQAALCQLEKICCVMYKRISNLAYGRIPEIIQSLGRVSAFLGPDDDVDGGKVGTAAEQFFHKNFAHETSGARYEYTLAAIPIRNIWFGIHFGGETETRKKKH